MEKSDQKYKSLSYFLAHCVVFIGLVCIVPSCVGGGGGSSSEATDDTHTDTGVVPLSVILGPIINATVRAYPLTDISHEIDSGTKQDSEDLDEAGKVDLYVPDEYNETPLYIIVEGGEDIDATDDGVRDEYPTVNNITLEFVFPTPDDIKDLQIIANPLLIFASGYVLQNVWRNNEAITDPEEVRMIMGHVAKSLIGKDLNKNGILDESEDVKVDGAIDWKDIVSFNPLEDSEKSIIPWDYVLEFIERIRSNNYSSFAPLKGA